MGIESEAVFAQEADIAVIGGYKTVHGRRGAVRRRPKRRQTVMEAGVTHPDTTKATRLH
jgi:hypothetical protein